MSISLVIGEYAICGIVSENKGSMYFETDRCWDVYCDCVRKNIVEKDVPVSILKNVKWFIFFREENVTFCYEIEQPTSHDIVLHDFYYDD